MGHVSLAALEAGLADVRRAPRDRGTVRLLVRRPAENQREVLGEGTLDPLEGLVGDCWRVRGSSRTADGAAHPDMQLTLMNARVAALVAGEPGRWPLAGDQLYVDLDLSSDHLPAGTRLRLGEAIVEITAEPHLGCGKFARRFGVDALRFVNSAVGRRLNLRGVNARVIDGGVVRAGDPVVRVGP